MLLIKRIFDMFLGTKASSSSENIYVNVEWTLIWPEKLGDMHFRFDIDSLTVAANEDHQGATASAINLIGVTVSSCCRAISSNLFGVITM